MNNSAIVEIALLQDPADIVGRVIGLAAALGRLPAIDDMICLFFTCVLWVNPWASMSRTMPEDTSKAPNLERPRDQIH